MYVHPSVVFICIYGIRQCVCVCVCVCVCAHARACVCVCARAHECVSGPPMTWPGQEVQHQSAIPETYEPQGSARGPDCWARLDLALQLHLDISRIEQLHQQTAPILSMRETAYPYRLRFECDVVQAGILVRMWLGHGSDVHRRTFSQGCCRHVSATCSSSLELDVQLQSSSPPRAGGQQEYSVRVGRPALRISRTAGGQQTFWTWMSCS